MPSIFNLLASIGMVLSLPTASPVATSGMDELWAAATVPTGSPLFDEDFTQSPFTSFVVHGLADQGWDQVRVEQRMIIRIAPRMPAQMYAPLPSAPQPPRFYERKTDKCLPITSIAGVQIESQDRLLLITRSRKLIGASLDKACHARDFYSGFYVERNEDGQLCAGRDTIHSRAGANCAITRMRELVPDDD
ncbi:hypothetical protein IQ25_00550 [Novosphingobium taihuense]|uniref:Uncharacterized protein n=2 Tax=Novosphingobium taihuense TaxID=260085 RepID=A0A7W7A8M4_9SPHN|nr:hypothetical protein [Novosphingobium taihuense]TWH88429.1 hypothetical protein IQ25_00550 [Novosphingobium taihuense]